MKSGSRQNPSAAQPRRFLSWLHRTTRRLASRFARVPSAGRRCQQLLPRDSLDRAVKDTLMLTYGTQGSGCGQLFLFLKGCLLFLLSLSPFARGQGHWGDCGWGTILLLGLMHIFAVIIVHAKVWVSPSLPDPLPPLNLRPTAHTLTSAARSLRGGFGSATEKFVGVEVLLLLPHHRQGAQDFAQRI